jgi:phenylacetyl-CoA:acceptor oxidoreductase
MNEVGRNMGGHGGIILNVATAKRLGICQGDQVEVRSITGSTRGSAVLEQGIRPDTVVIIGQFDHWKTPYAKELQFPSLNTVAALSLDLTDSTGSGSDLVRVSIRASQQP